MLYEVVLGLGGEFHTKFTVNAENVREAVKLALESDFDTLEWTDAAGNVVPWEEVDDRNVQLAEL